jgi:hypothetical protein
MDGYKILEVLIDYWRDKNSGLLVELQSMPSDFVQIEFSPNFADNQLMVENDIYFTSKQNISIVFREIKESRAVLLTSKWPVIRKVCEVESHKVKRTGLRG